MLDWHVRIIYHGFNDLKSIFFLIVLHISRYLCHFLYKNMWIAQKTACPFRQVQTKMYLPESPFSKNSLAGASTYVEP